MFRLRAVFVLLIGLMSLLLVTTVGLAQGSADSDIPEVIATMSDGGVTFSPTEIKAGITTLVIENTREATPYAGLIARFKEGVTMEDLMATVGDQIATVQLLHIYGGMPVPPATSGSVIVDLKPGPHVFLDFYGPPMFFDVIEADGETAAPPEADVTLAMVDFAFGVIEDRGWRAALAHSECRPAVPRGGDDPD